MEDHPHDVDLHRDRNKSDCEYRPTVPVVEVHTQICKLIAMRILSYKASINGYTRADRYMPRY